MSLVHFGYLEINKYIFNGVNKKYLFYYLFLFKTNDDKYQTKCRRAIHTPVIRKSMCNFHSPSYSLVDIECWKWLRLDSSYWKWWWWRVVSSIIILSAGKGFVSVNLFHHLWC